jgi:MFS family permease
MTDFNQPTKSYRTFVLILLTIVYGFNFIDRQIVGILAPFIQEDLSLTNTELGLLIGLAFAVFYTTVAIPIAWLADRYNRVNILSIALATWSGFTALTGLATNFVQIGLARMGVGIGEAGGSHHLIPLSLICIQKKKEQALLEFMQWVYLLGSWLHILLQRLL